MKSEVPFHFSNFPLKIAEDDKPVYTKPPLRIIELMDYRNQRFAFIENNAIQDAANWDPSWFANYE